MFSDDTALLAEKYCKAQELLHYVEVGVEKVGVHLNAKKTVLYCI